MNTKLEETFNMSHELPKEETENNPIEEEIINLNKYVDLDKIDSALPLVRDLEASDKEFDDLSKEALEGYKTLFELGQNVEMRHAGEIFGAATTLLGHAITAKTNKIKKKLDMIDLQLKKRKLDLIETRNNSNNDKQNTTEGKAVLINRNDLLAEILKSAKTQNNEKSSLI